MTAPKPNCWEVLRCGRQPGGARAAERGPCPAATDTTCDGINSGVNAGRFCWAIGGTLCADEVQGTADEKAEACRQCAFFRQVKYEQGCHFQTRRPGLGLTEAADLHRLLNDATRLLGICRDIFACLAVQPLLTLIVEHACAITRAASASAYLVDASGERLLLKAHAGPLPRPDRVSTDAETPVADAARSRRPCQGSAVVAGSAGVAAVAAVPIGGAETPAGVVELVKTQGRFSNDDMWFLHELSLMAALGIDNAGHIQDLRQLKQFDKAKSRFVALLMHHISSPLATIACSLQAIRQIGEDLSGEDRRKLLEISQERINSIQALSRRLLDLAAIRSGKSLAELRPVPVAEPLREEVEARTPHARELGVELVLTPRGDGARVLADPDGLRLIFGNLIGNAVKYSGGAGKQVDIGLAAHRGVVRVCIRDRGIGIPADEQTRVFEEFHRAANAVEVKASGFGLGLAMVKELVDRYGGRVDLESQVGVGTTVSVTFPIASAAASQDTAP